MRWSSFFDTAYFWWMWNLIKISMTKSRAELKILKACLFSKERNIISFSSLGSSIVVFHSAVVWWRPDWWRPIYHKMSNQREREWERLCVRVRVREWVREREREWESWTTQRRKKEGQSIEHHMLITATVWLLYSQLVTVVGKRRTTYLFPPLNPITSNA